LNNFSKIVASVEESRTLSITALIKKLKSEGKDVLSFSAGEPDFNTPDYIKTAAIEAINKNFTRYTANEGSPDLVKAIIKKFKEDNELVYEPANILVSNGAKHSIFNLILAICNPGDEVVFQSPYWVSYPEIVKLAGAVPVIIDADVSQEYKITPDQLDAAVNSKTKAFILNSPSNPTGAVYSEKEIQAFCEVLKDKEIYVISDEIYEKIIFDGEKHLPIASVACMKDKTITVNGVSKAYAMTGWRIGFAAGNKEIIRLARNLQSHSTSNASSISQAATVAALNGGNLEIEYMVSEFQKRRDFIVAGLNEIEGIICPIPKGAFYVFFDVSSYYGKEFNDESIKDSTSFCNYLLKEVNVGLVPGIAFGNDKCVRMSYACSMDEIKEGLKRIKTGLEKIG
jgi:aspartate aminotransferase